jgi:exopolysaccharide production protein ExoQ
MKVREQRIAFAWSTLLAVQAVVSEFNFELVVTEGSRVDDARRILQALLLFLPILLIAPRSAVLERHFKQRPVRAAFIWLAWGFASILWSIAPSETAIIMASTFGLWVTAAWYVWNFGFEKFAHVYVTATSAFMLAGLFYEMTLVSELGLVRRFDGISLHATNLGRLSMVTALLTLVLLIEFGWRGWAAWSSLAISLTTLATTGTRTAISVFVISVLILAYRRIGAGRALALALVCLIGAFVASLLVQDTVEAISRADGEEELTSFNGRTDVWDSALESIADRPFLGAGIGSTTDVFAMANSRGELLLQVGHAHNLALGQLMTQGILGFGLFLAMIASYFTARSSGASALAPAVLIAILLGGVTEAIFNRPTALILVLAALYAERAGGGINATVRARQIRFEPQHEKQSIHGQ